MATIGERLNDPEYRNWIRAALCLQYTRDGLVTFADQKSQELYNIVIPQLDRQGIPTVNILCGAFDFNKRTNTYRCCNGCGIFQTELKTYLHGITNLNLGNSDTGRLLQQHWQMAKLFMNVGQDKTNIVPNNTDISGLLNFMDHCSIPRGGIAKPDNIKKVRDTRNRVIHSADQKVSEHDFQNDIGPLLVELLEDPATLLNNREAKLAVERIKEIMGDNFVITKESEKNALEELVKEIRQTMKCAKQIMESNESTSEEVKKAFQEIQKVQILQERLKKIEDQQDVLRSDVKLLEVSIKAVKEDLNAKHESLGKKQEEQEKRIGNLEAKFEEPKPPTEAGNQDRIMCSELQRLAVYLKDGYKRDKYYVQFLPECYRIPVSEIYAPVILIREDLRQQQTTGEEKKLGSYKDIFDEGEFPQKQIILLGEAGAGKSTFCTHLIDVWCNQASQFRDPEVLGRFRFLFRVSCRFAKAEDTVLDMIRKQLFNEESKKKYEHAKYVLTHSPEVCLIIIDGLDEWECHQKQEFGRRDDVPGLPNNTGVESCCILMTSRPWRVHALPTKTKARILELGGLQSPDDLITNIRRKLEDPDPAGSCVKFLDEVGRCNMNEMLKTPLVLIIALSMWEQNKSLHQSLCQNYMHMIESFIQRADDKQHWTGGAKRLMEPLVTNLNILKTNWKEKSGSLPSCCQKLESFNTFSGLINSLSHMAFDFLFVGSEIKETRVDFDDGTYTLCDKLQLSNQKLVFSHQDCKKYLSEDELNVCLGIGILAKCQTSRGIVKIESFSFPHKTFQEFLSALWLAGPGADSIGKFTERIIQYGTFDTVLGDLQLLIKFLCGLNPQVGADIFIYIYKQCWIADVDKLNDFVFACSVESQHCNNTEYELFTLPGIIVSYSMSMDKFRMLTDILKSLSLDLRCLYITDLSLDHSSFDKFYQSVRCFVNLECLRLWNISCSDDRRGNISSKLDLHNLHKLEVLVLWNVSVTTVVWPQVTNSCLRELTIRDCNNISSELNLHNHHKLERLQLYNLSVTTVVWPQVTNSCLRDLVIKDCNNISSELNLHNLHKLEALWLRNLSVTTVLWPQVTNSCLRELNIRDCNNISSELNLLNHHKLEKLTLENLSVTTVVWPQVTNSCLTWLIIYNLKLTHECVEELCRTYEQCRQSEMEYCEKVCTDAHVVSSGIHGDMELTLGMPHCLCKVAPVAVL